MVLARTVLGTLQPEWCAVLTVVLQRGFKQQELKRQDCLGSRIVLNVSTWIVPNILYYIILLRRPTSVWFARWQWRGDWKKRLKIMSAVWLLTIFTCRVKRKTKITFKSHIAIKILFHAQTNVKIVFLFIKEKSIEILKRLCFRKSNIFSFFF